MDVSSGEAFVAPLPEFDFELGSLDGLEFMDLDLLDEFWDGGIESFLAVPGKEAGLLGLGDAGGEGGGRESSPDSVVTDDGAPSSSEPYSSGDREDGGGSEIMSAYVSELERFLMEDGDGGYEDREPTAPADEEVAADADGYYFDDLFVAQEDCYPAPADAVTPGAGAGPEEEELSVDEYFFDDLYVADDGYTEPGAGAGVHDAETAGLEELAGDEYLFDDFSFADDGRAGPAAGVVDPASPDADEELADDFAAREDEATSRKRARYE